MQKHFDVVLDSIAAFFLDSSYEPLSDLFKEVVMRMGGDKDVIANDYAEHSVTLGKKEELYYLIHQLGTRVKAQVWSLNGGALSDFIRNSFDDVVREIGVKGLEFIPINERDILESQFVQSEYNYQESRRKMGF